MTKTKQIYILILLRANISNIRYYEACMFLNVTVKRMTWSIQILEIDLDTDPVLVSNLEDDH